MSLFDDLKQKAEELMNGGVVEDLTNQAGDLGEQAQNLKDNILPGEGGENDGQQK